MKARVARHEVREEIQRRILSGETKPGERLSQQGLARELGVAQGTVRESLLELHWLGLVQSVDHMGVFVDKLDVASISEAYHVREVLEGLAARLACGNAGRADIAELRTMADRIYRLAQDRDNETGSLDRSFHLRITELSRNSTLTRLSQAYRVLGMTVRAFRDPAVIYAEHLRIVEAIEHNFADEAERLARSHVVDARQTIETMANQGTFVPEWVK
ncbi:MAG TPA: GntR family transcriptional regulator [Terracidiphilus sp.]|nr:GntR family transcriptional regulator [Terracidiphilus sp.]